MDGSFDYLSNSGGESLSLEEAYEWLDKSLKTIHRAGWYRAVKPLESPPGPVIILKGKSLLNFASNDYLGLAGDSRLIEAAIAATRQWGTGSTGSRLLSGHRPLHDALEKAIASLKQTEDGIVFSSGYLANLGTITALVGPRDLIVSDRYNHASLKNGARLSNAKIVEYDHSNVGDLKHQLHTHRHQYRRCLIITDSVFSMDGDCCPLPAIMELAEAFSCMVLVDEAHATGVMGKTGAGCVEHFNLRNTPLIQMGTLSKAVGSLGGYVAGSAPLIDFLRNRASSWIYTTALSPADTAAALKAIEIIQQDSSLRDQLWANVAHFKTQLSPKLQSSLLPSDSPILCLTLESPQKAIAISQTLEALGIFAPAIRPPTVPTSRIRFSLMATHTPQQIQQLVDAIGKAWQL